MGKVLKFSYFLVLILLASCKSETKKEKETEVIQETDSTNSKAVNTTNKVMLFYGNSLTAGYGLDDEKEAFPYLIQQKLDSMGLDYTVINSGLSGETTSGGKNRLDWVLSQQVEVFVLELGANDGLRGIPITETKSNLQAIIIGVKQKNPQAKIVLAGMQIPPNMGQAYTSAFKNVFYELAEENEVYLIPFLLKNVGGIPELNQEDGIHPTAEGQKIVADNVWNVLKDIVKLEDSIN
ncbi:acyl-CoA thioesterase-1 [Saonia flava]|uniref:Acyl-CoA thioesterase-1 n=1 Tax=Saonia flava TaxID=523696 RepID=A0A846QVQ0_9FLAO|nr:arylesterase [Saonia flava]NJB72381.1 acyl-CoA thioesterase-1 [Saonia flava]